VSLYAAGVILLVVRMGAGCVAAVRLKRSGQRVAEWDREAPMDDSVLVSPRVTVPMTVGVVAPRVLLPVSWRQWSARTLAAVLAHERAHVRRRDLLVALFARVNACVFWFNPAAWVVERQLARAAEHAADEAAVRATGYPADYARVLLDMAAHVRRSGHRIAWQTVGMDGASGLEGRIDRVLRGESGPATRGQWFRAAAVSVVLIAAVVACRRSAPPTDLEPDPALTKQLDDQKANAERTRAAWAMTPEDAVALHETWRRDRAIDAADQLLRYYEPVHNGRWVASAPDWAARRREVALWAIEHQPGTTLARRANFIFSPSSKLPDPEGARRAGLLWRAVAEGRTTDSRALGNAASFFVAGDPRLAERTLIRAQTIDPAGGQWTEANVFYSGRWASELGRLYAEVLTGRGTFTQVPAGWSGTMASPTPIDAAAARGAFAAEIRTKLDASRDASLLLATGRALAQPPYFASAGAKDLGFDPAALGRTYLERALALDPNLTDARFALHDAKAYWPPRPRWNWAPVTPGMSPDEQLAALATLPESDRLAALGGFMDAMFRSGEVHDYYVRNPAEVAGSKFTYTQAGAEARWRASKQAARDALALAARLPDHPDAGTTIFRANIALALHAFREGDRLGALRGLSEAAKAPPTDDLRYGSSGGSMLEYRLTDGLLKYGERDVFPGSVEHARRPTA
jgi:hypothetical protein